MMSIHVDIDNFWVYEREYGVSFGLPPGLLFEQTLPYLLNLLEQHDVRATFFVIGQDLELGAARRFCIDAVARGHALGNHTYTHPIQWGRLAFSERRIEIQRCHDAIVATTGQAPIGFRSPGYFLDRDTVEILLELGYTYDSSVLPGHAYGLMRAYMRVWGVDARSKAFGRWWYMIASRHPRCIVSVRGRGTLLELPISVMPFVRLPTHMTFLSALGRRYLAFAKALYRLDPRNHVYLLHAIDAAELPRSVGEMRRVIPFRRSFADRDALVKDAVTFLRTIHGGPIRTTESQLQDFRERRVPPLRMMSYE